MKDEYDVDGSHNGCGEPLTCFKELSDRRAECIKKISAILKEFGLSIPDIDNEVKLQIVGKENVDKIRQLSFQVNEIIDQQNKIRSKLETGSVL